MLSAGEGTVGISLSPPSRPRLVLGLALALAPDRVVTVGVLWVVRVLAFAVGDPAALVFAFAVGVLAALAAAILLAAAAVDRRGLATRSLASAPLLLGVAETSPGGEVPPESDMGASRTGLGPLSGVG